MKSNQRKASPRKIVYKFILLQVIVTILLAIFMWQSKDIRAAYSVIVAGLVCIIPNCYFTWSVFRYQGARAAKSFLVAFCFGEIVKLFLIAILFVLAVVVLKVAIRPFLVGFIVNLLIFWLAPLIQFGFIDRKKG